VLALATLAHVLLGPWAARSWVAGVWIACAAVSVAIPRLQGPAVREGGGWESGIGGWRLGAGFLALAAATLLRLLGWTHPALLGLAYGGAIAASVRAVRRAAP